MILLDQTCHLTDPGVGVPLGVPGDDLDVRKAELIDSFRDEWDGLTEEEVERWLSGTVASGDPVEENEIDDVLYGSEPE